MRLLAGIVLSAFSLAASAQTVTATWTNATLNTNGTAIPASGAGSLVRTVVEYGSKTSTGGFGVKAGEVFVAAPATTLQLSLVVTQEYALRAFHCNTYATSYVVNATGCSGFSNVAVVTVQAPAPGAPSNLTITATQVGGSNWTCRSATGEILSSHTTPHKAQESCTNQALAHVGSEYRAQPDGYIRILAQVR